MILVIASEADRLMSDYLSIVSFNEDDAKSYTGKEDIKNCFDVLFEVL